MKQIERRDNTHRHTTTALPSAVLLLVMVFSLLQPLSPYGMGEDDVYTDRTPAIPLTVQGNITYEGQPTAGASVTLQVVDPQGQVHEKNTTKTDSSGHYIKSLAYYREGDTIVVTASYNNLSATRYREVRLKDPQPDGTGDPGAGMVINIDIKNQDGDNNGGSSTLWLILLPAISLEVVLALYVHREKTKTVVRQGDGEEKKNPVGYPKERKRSR